MIYLILTLLLILTDQITKVLTIKYIPFEGSVGFIPGLISFSYIKNSGAAWGIFAGGRWFFIIFTALVLIFLTVIIVRAKSKNIIFNLSTSLIFAGAIGNFIDRIFRDGMVIDMIKLDFMSFPVFNFADCCVVVGALLLCIYILFYFDKEKDDGKN